MSVSSSNHFSVLIGGLFVILVAVVIFTLTGHYGAAALTASAQLLWLMSFMAYIVLIHSKKRWPHRSVFERLYSILALKD